MISRYSKKQCGLSRRRAEADGRREGSRGFGDYFANVVDSSYTQSCTLRSILIFSSDLEYL